jgi:PEP-CTERM motif
MKSTLLAVGFCSLAVSVQAGIELVSNGGFETGDFSGWTHTGLLTYTKVDSLGAHSGSYGYDEGAVTIPHYISQILSTVPNTAYAIDFWLRPNGTSGFESVVKWGGNTIYDATDQTVTTSGLTVHAWNQVHFNVVATSSSTTLELGLRQDVGWSQLDDVSVTAVPEPSTYLAGLSAIGMLGLFAWKSRK